MASTETISITPATQACFTRRNEKIKIKVQCTLLQRLKLDESITTATGETAERKS